MCHLRYLPMWGIYVQFHMELDESAKMDGAGKLTVFWRIIFPLLRPATATTVIFLCLWIWNDFVSPSIILGSTKAYTVTTGIYPCNRTVQYELGRYICTSYYGVFSNLCIISVYAKTIYCWTNGRFGQGIRGTVLQVGRNCSNSPRLPMPF